MIKCPDAAELSQTGRFYLQVGFNELFALGQSAWCGADYVPTETVEKTVDTSIQVVDNLGRVLASVKPAKKEETSRQSDQAGCGNCQYLSDLAVEEKNPGAAPLAAAHSRRDLPCGFGTKIPYATPALCAESHRWGV